MLELLLPRVVLGLLVGLRVAGVMLIGPFWGSGFFPVRVRVMLALVLTFVLSAALPMPAGLPLDGGHEILLVLLGAKELILGLGMGLVGRLVMSSVKLAGQLISMQIGMAAANLMDPSSQVQVSLMGNVLGLLAMAVLLAINGHHQVLLGLQMSLTAVPPDRLLPPLMMSQTLVDAGSKLFLSGLQMATPVVITVFFVNTGLGVLARTVPQMNIFIVGFLVSVLVGLSMVGLSLPGIAQHLTVRFDGLAEQMLMVLR